jgi:glycosyltransferase involved in cell wall biosynthesis
MGEIIQTTFCAGPLVSIVITSYNYDRYLAATIESALSQSYRHTEVIVVDDGSTDSSRDIIQSFGSRCLSIFRENGGEAAASRSGFKASRGDIVLFLDSDDLLDHDAVAQIVAAWRSDCTKAQFYLRVVDSAGHPLGCRKPNIDFVPDREVRKCLFHYGYYPSPPTSGNAYARAFLLDVLPATKCAWRNGIDGYLNALAPLHGEIISIPVELGSYRMHDRNMSAWSDLTLDTLRDGMLREIERERAIIGDAARRGVQIRHGLVTNIPSHCKARLLSLRLDSNSHPIQGDTLSGLFAQGIAAVWRFPHMTLAKRLGSSIGLAALLMLPRSWLDRWLHALFVAEQRPQLSDFLPPSVRNVVARSSA